MTTTVTVTEVDKSAMSDAERLAVDLSREYLMVRVLPDGSVAAVHPLITTTSIILGCTREGWARRFCFEDPGVAFARFLELQSEDDTPDGAIASRGRP